MPISLIEPHRGKRIKDDWITPKYFIDILGNFDLDPCASLNQPWPCADKQFTINDDGLHENWRGCVWCNPPYSQLKLWLKKLSEHGEGVALTFARTETMAFHQYVFPYASGIYFLEGRIKFYHSNGLIGGSAGAPSCLISYGDEGYRRLLKSNFKGCLFNAYWKKLITKIA